MKLDYNTFWPEEEPPTSPPPRTTRPPQTQQQRQAAVVRDIGIRVALYGIGGWLVGFFSIILFGLLVMLLQAIF